LRQRVPIAGDSVRHAPRLLTTANTADAV